VTVILKVDKAGNEADSRELRHCAFDIAQHFLSKKGTARFFLKGHIICMTIDGSVLFSGKCFLGDVPIGSVSRI